MKSRVQLKDEKIINVLEDVKESLSMIFGAKLKKIILFGSYARDEAEDESDIDILLLIDENREKMNQYHYLIVNVMFEFSLKHNVVISIMEQEFEQYNKYKKFVPFYANVDNEGVEFYAR
jgi:uncharacterized protein